MRLLVLFNSTRDVIRAERLCREKTLPCKAIPVPRNISSQCGIVLEITPEERENVSVLLASAGIENKFCEM